MVCGVVAACVFAGLFAISYIANIPLSALRTIDLQLLLEIKTVLDQKLGRSAKIASVIQLSGSCRRNRIVRIMLDEELKSVILKQAVSPDGDDKDAIARFSRDGAGLKFFNEIASRQALVPQFYGASTKKCFVLLEDLGERHVSLVDALMQRRVTKAKAALRRFVRSLGRFHATSYGKTGRYVEILHSMSPDCALVQEYIDDFNECVVPKVVWTLQSFGIEYSHGMQVELDSVVQAVLKAGPFTTYLQGDMCPDNMFDYPRARKVKLIDFEYGFVGCAFLDLAYVRMSMPTCWCARAIPGDFIDELEALYRKEILKKIPAAQDDALYGDAYVKACAYWMIRSGIALINAAFHHDIQGKLRPRVLSRLNTFVEVASRFNLLPHLRTMAQQLLAALKIQWPEAQQMDMYPAFQQRKVRCKKDLVPKIQGLACRG